MAKAEDQEALQLACYTYLLGAFLHPLPRVGVVDPASDLQAAGPGSEGLGGGLVVLGAQHDDVPAPQVVVPVQAGEVARGLQRDMVGPQRVRRAVQSPADNLLHLARMQVYAGPELGHYGFLSIG